MKILFADTLSINKKSLFVYFQHCTKNKVSIKYIFSKCAQICSFLWIFLLNKFTEQINGKLHFLCSGEIIFPSPAIYILLLFKTLHYVFKSDSVKISSQKAWLHRLYATPGLSSMQINQKIIIDILFILFILPFSLKMRFMIFLFLISTSLGASQCKY